MPQKITEHAMLLCDKGTATGQLKVTSQNFCKAADKFIATEQDKQAEVNIPGFGNCTVTKNKCVAAIIQWNQTSGKDTINGYKILTENSICQCSVGGKITIQNKGHTETHEIA
ncbi:DUF4280 domain-containing protein [Taibaiella soli]|uniref:DUF4280 domain-containing protein n=1 Tax=Taibaiella soli TaxID=1649169 RepID=A0A2W2B4C1_9BACT|nr:DUF4280 domain-containing protein [Taibaiella soli]PZF70987.1 DUF4280 domain-containing protein [Taibaiella soli]